MKSWGKLLLSFLFILAFLVGCSSNDEQEPGNTAESKADEAADQTADQAVADKEKLRVYAAIKLADERILGITDTKTVENVEYHVVKEGFDAEKMKQYFESVFTPEYADQVLNTFVAEVEGVGTVIQLPEDYVDFSGVNQDAIQVSIDGDHATATAEVNGKQVTYELKKLDGKWKVANKTVQ